MTHALESTTSFISPQERARLVRLCATMTGDSGAAEDLAQEVLLEAWRPRDAQRDYGKQAMLCESAPQANLRYIACLLMVSWKFHPSQKAQIQ